MLFRFSKMEIREVSSPSAVRSLTLVPPRPRSVSAESPERGEIKSSLPCNPRHDAAQALADAVLLSLRSGDLVAARAAARALSVLVDALTDASATEQGKTVQDLAAARKSRGERD